MLIKMKPFWKVEITHEAAAMLEHLPEDIDLVGAEVGVLRAKTACILLHRRPKLWLYLVDDWADENEGPTCEAVYQEALRNLEPFMDRVRIIRADSTLAASALEDDSLDFVHIDADHHYPKCLLDMIAWWPKIREFGQMFHHDIDHPDFPAWGVRRAVEEFARLYDVDFAVNSERLMATIIKPPAAMGRPAP